MMGKLYKVIKDDSEVPAYMREYEVMAETNRSITIRAKGVPVISFSVVKVGTEFFETPEEAVKDFKRQQRNYIDRLQGMLLVAKETMIEAEAL